MPSLNVTQVNVNVLSNIEGRLRGTVRIILNDEIQLTGLRIYEGFTGLFVSYPNDPFYKGDDYRQLFYPVTKELRMHIEEEVIKAYRKQLRREED